ncbi:phosphoribosylformylglycinamidine synthase subunit PurL [Egibacter rhizosphaerae]|uniref:Phosphoribosylformylglycinamidine synthase subunit PurL n=1 Tax=Egibacter rhizosphaerae TaxID=1670831 RepID=A0A411YGA7_9ACTN|nr:phosphoribosylformylglycinamidine synthase subunit PurL [Egibacter rhizosphaerae]QBI20181.1 phosphoribosylformylglycinamidine synthase subunit PurL [Egibacter rhizosphaerae]
MTSPAPTGTPASAPDPDGLAGELGLTEDELTAIRRTLGRDPSSAELGAYSVMWSEHCSYKSSRIHLRRLPAQGPRVLVGPGENAGVVSVAEGLAAAFKIESHNHPSFVEPYQGAATGVGGIIRDVLTMGARPIALLDALRFGDPDDPVARRVADGVVRGVGGYGNSIGVPTVGGETDFDPAYATNPLVNVLCVGAVPADRVQLARAERPGHVAVLVGQRTGRDGIGGASVLASAGFGASDADEAKRPNVQVGDPFAGKLLIECCLELVDAELLSGIQDMGAAGIVCSAAEMAAAAELGIHLDLDRVPLREPSMQAWEILCSESQERMLALVDPDRLGSVLDVCARWGVAATPIGEITTGDRLVATHEGEIVMDAPAVSLADDGPVYERPVGTWAHPAGQDDARADLLGIDLDDAAWTVLTAPDVAPCDWITEQYDAIVGAATVLGPGADAAVLRLPTERLDGDPAGRSTCAVAVAVDGHPRRCALDPGRGARLVLAEAARNVACVGAEPVGATNNLNFGAPERADVMGAFSATVDGLAAAADALGTPITGGNVSFYNQTGDRPIHPTPVVGVLGVLDDVAEAVGPWARRAGDTVVLLAAPEPADREEAAAAALAGSAVQWHVAGRIAGRPPEVDLAAEAALHRVLRTANEADELTGAHDVADGGLLVALVEALRGTGLGADIAPVGDGDRTDVVDPLAWLLGELPTRVLAITERPTALAQRAAAEGIAARALGTVTATPRLAIGDWLALDLAEVEAAQRAVLPRALDPDGPSTGDEQAGAPARG